MAAPSAFQFFANNLDIESLTGLPGAVVKCALVASTYTPNTTETGHTVYSDFSANEIANGNGYTTGGAALTNDAVTAITGGFKYASDAVSWTASGAGIPAWRYAVFYVEGSLWGLTNPLIGYFTGDSAPADVPLTASGNVLQLNCPANGWFTKTRT